MDRIEMISKSNTASKVLRKAPYQKMPREGEPSLLGTLLLALVLRMTQSS